MRSNANPGFIVQTDTHQPILAYATSSQLRIADVAGFGSINRDR